MLEEPEDFIPKESESRLLSKSFSGSTIPNFFKIDSIDSKNLAKDQGPKTDKTQQTNLNKIPDSDIENRNNDKDRPGTDSK